MKKKQAFNPFLPSYEYIPDGEPFARFTISGLEYPEYFYDRIERQKVKW